MAFLFWFVLILKNISDSLGCSGKEATTVDSLMLQVASMTQVQVTSLVCAGGHSVPRETLPHMLIGSVPEK